MHTYIIEYITRGGCIVLKYIDEALTRTDAIAELRETEEDIQEILPFSNKILNPTMR